MIPKYNKIMQPLLKLFNDGYEHHRNDFNEILAKHFNVNNEEQQVVIKSGSSQFNSRIYWALTFLKQSVLIQTTKRGYYKITNRGLDYLSKGYAEIDPKSLVQLYPELLNYDFWNEKIRHKEGHFGNQENVQNIFQESTPEDQIEEGYNKLNNVLKEDVLNYVKTATPIFFEKVVVDLLVKMGYGGSVEDAGKTTKISNDEGIDGIIKEDVLGLGNIYVQAKRFTENTIGRPEIQKFVGALAGKKAKKGVFITTSQFSKTAEEYLKNLDFSIILIDGNQLAEYMIKYNVGVNVKQVIEIKKINSDFFEEI